MRFRHLPLLVLLSLALLAPAAPASHATAGQATTAAKKAKACKRKKGEGKTRWLKRCKCKSFKAGETRRRFKQRCPGAKVPRRKAPSGGGGSPAPPTTPAPTTPPAASDVDKVTAALTGTQLQYFTYSSSSGASDNERYRFCAGTFEYTRNRVALSGLAYDSSGAGTWRITQATVNPDGASGTAVLHYDLTSLQWNDVDPAPAQSGDVPMSFSGSKVDFGGRVYDATKITC